jgi:hypothetical protein
MHPSHIYPGEVTPVRKPQRSMNPTLKDIVKEEIQKLLNVRFIYPISNSKWVSPLIVVPKKVIRNGEFVLIPGNSTKPLLRITFLFLPLTKLWIPCLERSIFPF